MITRCIGAIIETRTSHSHTPLSGPIRRDDTEQIHFVRLEKPLPNNFIVSLQYQRIQNDSNLPVYDYTQNVFYVVTTWIY